MIPFKTTPDQILTLPSIVVAMHQAGLDKSFIVAADELARADQGVFDLMEMWLDSSDPSERTGRGRSGHSSLARRLCRRPGDAGEEALGPQARQRVA